ncbi:MAG: hypothetical protein H7X71_07170 [Chitinophagales bacterium]|nr:hypothetical protein [Chitinophagales bacterium]
MNNKIIDRIKKLHRDITDHEGKSSFPSDRKTIYHIWYAQIIWLSRLKGYSPGSWAHSAYENDFADYDINYIDQSRQFDHCMRSKKNDDELLLIIQFKT